MGPSSRTLTIDREASAAANILAVRRTRVFGVALWIANVGYVAWIILAISRPPSKVSRLAWAAPQPPARRPDRGAGSAWGPGAPPELIPGAASLGRGRTEPHDTPDAAPAAFAGDGGTSLCDLRHGSPRHAAPRASGAHAALSAGRRAVDRRSPCCYGERGRREDGARGLCRASARAWTGTRGKEVRILRATAL